MKSGKLTNMLLAFVFLALLAHLVIPMFRAGDASAAGKTSISPSQAAADAGIPPVYAHMTGKISAALGDIASSNQEIAEAVRENTRANAEIARSLDGLTRQMLRLSQGSASSGASTPSAAPHGSTPDGQDQESNPNWWRQYMDE